MDYKAICWAQVKMCWCREYVLSADFKLPTIESPKRNLYKKQPINIHFEIPFFTVSGFQVRYLKIVDRSGYKASPWVKYLTKNGEYQIRMTWSLQMVWYGLIIVLSWLMSIVSEYLSPLLDAYSRLLDGEYIATQMQFKGSKDLGGDYSNKIRRANIRAI